MGVDSDPATLAKALTVIQDPNDKTNVSLTLDLTFEISVMNDNRYPVRVDELVLDVRFFPCSIVQSHENLTILNTDFSRSKCNSPRQGNCS